MDAEDKVKWEPRPLGPAREEGFQRIIRLQPGSRRAVILVGPPIGVWLHYLRSQGSMPHLNSDCPYCPARVHRRWYGPALDAFSRVVNDRPVQGWKEAVYELTDQALDSLSGHPEIRGLAVTLHRARYATAPVTLEVCSQQPAGVPPKPWNVWPVLVSIWGMPFLMHGFEEGPGGRRELRVFQSA